MQAGAEGRRVNQSERPWLGREMRGKDAQVSGGDRPRAEDPGGAGVARRGGRHDDVIGGDAEGAGDLRRRDVVGHQRRDAARASRFGVDCPQIDQTIERVRGDAGEIDTVGHATA